jgi:uncharacterized protein
MTSAKTDKLWRGKVMRLATTVAAHEHVHERLAHVNGEAITTILKNLMRGHYPAERFDTLWQATAVEHPTFDGFWADRDSRPLLRDVDIPVYLGCDWDNVIMHLPGTFTSWKALAHNENVRMTLLPEGGLNWPWESMHEEALAWYDHWLKGVDTGIMEGPRIRYYLPGSHEWRTAGSWPPEESTIVEYALRADGTLAVDDATEGSRSYLYLTPEAGRPRNANPPALPDRLDWVTPAMTSALDLAGNIELRLDATITGLDTGWIAVLHDLAPDGTETPVSAGWLRAMLRTVDGGKSAPGAPVVPCREPVAVPARQAVTHHIPIVPSARRLDVGHRLRLLVTSADAPKTPTTILGFAHTAVGEPSVNTIHASSRLLLPVLAS